MRRHTAQTLVGQLDFVTSPAPDRTGPVGRGQASGRGVTRLITPLGVLSREDGELTLSSANPGISVAEVRAATGWPLEVAPSVRETEPPTGTELRLLRDVLDPRRIYLR
jgi:glutaconate CoA-transferase subunit B